ncbi:MAG: type II toxin-antitoxin system RelE/ParE family toxin [Rickettsiales bacterium]
MKLRWTSPALNDLESIADYIGCDNPQAAAKLLGKMHVLVYRLCDYPASGHAGRVAGTREAVLPQEQYTVVYRVAEDALEIIAVLHHARQWPKN